MPLTATAARQAAPREKAYKLSDEKGLFLLVQPNGRRYWRPKYRYAGKEKVLALGVFPEVSLAEARDRRDKARALLRDRIDPAAERRTQEHEARVAAANSFEHVASERHRHARGRWSQDHAERVWESLKADVFPKIGRRPIAELKAPELLDVVRAVESRGALDVASRIQQRITAVFRFALQAGGYGIDTNPAAELKGVLQQRKVTHRRAVGKEKIPDLLRKLDAYPGRPETRLALLLGLHTVVRSKELVGARWAELDQEEGLWRIPAQRMKMQRDHLVPLSRQVLTLLEELRPLTGRYELLFPNQNSTKRPISQNALIFGIYRIGFHQRLTFHGFRAMFSTAAHEAGWLGEAIDRQLAHVERNKTKKAYNRAEHLETRKELMQWWSDYLDSMRSEGKVVQLASRRGA